MNFSKLTRQLRREATTNPKKATFLGLMFVVALWFWSPLVWGWFAEKGSSTELAAAAPHAAQANVAPTVALSGKNTVPGATEVVDCSWSKVARWMDDDRLTRAVGLTDHRRDPFLASRPEADEAIREHEEELSADVTPESLGLVLSSTIVGPQRRVALINGKPYRQDQPVTLVNGGTEIEFVIEEIDSRRVVLRRNGERFDLRTQPRKLSGQIQRAD